MGTQNDKEKTNKDLTNLAKVSNPIMPIKGGRACIIEDGKIILNFRHYKDDYDNLNANLEKIKNKMNLIISDEMLEMIQMKFENLKNTAKNEEIKSSIESFSSSYKTSLTDYYNLIKEIKKAYKQSYLSITEFLTNWLKIQKETDTSQEMAKVEQFEKKIGEIQNNFNNFSDIEEIINKICYFNIDYESKDKLNEINKYFEDNKNEILNDYNFENLAQFRSLINLRDQIIDSINQKNNFVEILNNFHKDYLEIYKRILSKINSSNLEKVEIVNEFNEYNGVVIYHRLIRSMEERIKKLKI